MKLHIRIEDKNKEHVKFTVFTDGKNCGTLCMGTDDGMAFIGAASQGFTECRVSYPDDAAKGVGVNVSLSEADVIQVRESAKAVLMNHGPHRVMTNPSEATSPKRAREEFDITPDIVFLRDDGWMLAAPMALAPEAWETWPDKWIGWMLKGDVFFKDMGDPELKNYIH